MSYSRFSCSDVYVYMDVNGTLACCGCRLNGDGFDDDGSGVFGYFDSTEAMIAHLDDHRTAGHDVPAGIDESLREDDAHNFPPTCREGHVWGEPFQPYPGHHPRLQRVKCADCEWVDSWPSTLKARIQIDGAAC